MGLKSGVDSVLVQRLLASESLILLSKTAQRAADVDGRRAVRLAFEVVSVMVVEGGGVEVEEDIGVGVVVAGVVGEGVVVVVVIVGVVGALAPWFLSQWARAAACRSLLVRGLGLVLRLSGWRGRCLFGRKNAA